MPSHPHAPVVLGRADLASRPGYSETLARSPPPPIRSRPAPSTVEFDLRGSCLVCHFGTDTVLCSRIRLLGSGPIALLFEQGTEIERAGSVTAGIRPSVGLDRAGAITLAFEESAEIACRGGMAAAVGPTVGVGREGRLASLLKQSAGVERAGGVAAGIRPAIGLERARQITLPFEQNSEVGCGGGIPARFCTPVSGHGSGPVALVLESQAEVECGESIIAAIRGPIAARLRARIGDPYGFRFPGCVRRRTAGLSSEIDYADALTDS